MSCIIPTCSNDRNKTPDKIFVKIREMNKQQWCRLVGAKYRKPLTMYCCEDHLMLQEDVENYNKWKLMDAQPLLKSSAKPRYKNITEKELVESETSSASLIKKAPNLSLLLLSPPEPEEDPLSLKRKRKIQEEVTEAKKESNTVQTPLSTPSTHCNFGISCIFPTCCNETADKLFVKIRDANKEEWCRLVGTEYHKSLTMYCCEDHLKLQEDIENYNKWKLMDARPLLKLTAKPRYQNITEKEMVESESSSASLIKKAPNLSLLLLSSPKPEEDPLSLKRKRKIQAEVTEAKKESNTVQTPLSTPSTHYNFGISCIFPTCCNETADKLFVKIRDANKEEWCRLVGTEYHKSLTMYCCEDHLKLHEDIENYNKWKLMDARPLLKLTAKPRYQNITEKEMAESESSSASLIKKAPNLSLLLLSSPEPEDPLSLKRKHKIQEEVTEGKDESNTVQTPPSLSTQSKVKVVNIRQLGFLEKALRGRYL